MYQIIQGLKTLIGPEFTIKNSWYVIQVMV
jgi:hypothetical protein